MAERHRHGCSSVPEALRADYPHPACHIVRRHSSTEMPTVAHLTPWLGAITSQRHRPRLAAHGDNSRTLLDAMDVARLAELALPALRSERSSAAAEQVFILTWTELLDPRTRVASTVSLAGRGRAAVWRSTSSVDQG